MPDSLKEACDLVLSSLSEVEIKAVIANPKESATWTRLVDLGLIDSNRSLLTDCIKNTTYKDKPFGVELVAWVSLMTSAERKLGVEAVEVFKYRP